MRKILHILLCLTITLSCVFSFSGCENFIALKDKITYPTIDEYVLKDEIKVVDGVKYQKSDLGYIGIGLEDETQSEVTMYDLLVMGYDDYGQPINQPVYAYKTDFIANNPNVKKITLYASNSLRLHTRAIHDVPNLESFALHDSIVFQGSPVIEKDAIDIPCDIDVGLMFFRAIKYFPLLVHKFVFSAGLDLYAEITVTFDQPNSNGVDLTSIKVEVPCTVTAGNYTREFYSPYNPIVRKGKTSNGDRYYAYSEVKNRLIEPGGKIPSDWIPYADYFKITVSYDVTCSYKETKVFFLQNQKEYTVREKGIILSSDSNSVSRNKTSYSVLAQFGYFYWEIV